MIFKPDPEVRSTFSNILFRSTYNVLTAYFVALLLELLIMFTAALTYVTGSNLITNI